jgi:glycosyltransferase involved in cell wall biosynthesis
MKAVHVITSTHTGGAEVTLLRLLQQRQQSPSRWYDPYVICLMKPGAISTQIEALGIPFESLSARRGMPLTIGEAMASGVPCVVTDVGDAARLVGDTSRVVQPRDAKAFAEACLALQSLPLIADRYLALHEQLAQREFLCAA